MKVTDMINLFVARNEAEDFNVLICAPEQSIAEQLAEEYRVDANMTGTFAVEPFSNPETQIDCDYVLSCSDNNEHGTENSNEEIAVADLNDEELLFELSKQFDFDSDEYTNLTYDVCSLRADEWMEVFEAEPDNIYVQEYIARFVKSDD